MIHETTHKISEKNSYPSVTPSLTPDGTPNCGDFSLVRDDLDPNILMKGEDEMRFSQHNSRFEFNTLSKCIETSQRIGEISVDDAETLSFFLDLVKEALTSRGLINA